MPQDRVGQDELALTEEFLAYMLGVRRASASIACGTLSISVSSSTRIRKSLC
jgi:hypothetical protein